MREIESEINFQDLSFRNREIKIPEPLGLKLNIYKTEDSFVFSGKLKGKFIIECSRCLESFTYPFEIEINEGISKQDIEDLKSFNVNDLLIKDIYLAIPIKPLCSEDCRGICPDCGQNLNQGDCDCETEKLDPRLSKLKKLYDEKDN